MKYASWYSCKVEREWHLKARMMHDDAKIMHMVELSSKDSLISEHLKDGRSRFDLAAIAIAFARSLVLVVLTGRIRTGTSCIKRHVNTWRRGHRKALQYGRDAFNCARC